MIKDILKNSIEGAILAAQQLEKPEAILFMEEVARAITETFEAGNKVIIAGNGGSLCDAAHFAEELTGFFRKKRAALPALVLNDPGHLTCVANDIGFDFVFSRGLEAFGKPNDLFIGLSTSGNSPNMVNAFETAKSMNIKTVAFLGKDGGKLQKVADLEWIVKGFSFSDRIQEAHMAAMHIIIELVEHFLFSEECCKKTLKVNSWA